MMEGLRETVIQTIMELIDEGKNIMMLVSDSTSTSKIEPLQNKYPERVINVGIAEQNLVGIAAGMSLQGFISITANAAPFLVGRANEQVKNDICYSNTNVKMLGLNAGVSYGSLASTHHAIDDISIMMGFGNVEIFAPCDPLETRQIIRYAVNKEGPVYIRMDSSKYENLNPDDYRFSAGEIYTLREGDDITLFATGSVVTEAVNAHDRLKQDGIGVKIISVPCLYPLNREAVIQELRSCGRVITVEEHSIHGGLGSIISDIATENGIGITLSRLGIHAHQFSIAGPQKEIWAHYGFNAEGIVNTIKNRLKR